MRRRLENGLFAYEIIVLEKRLPFATTVFFFFHFSCVHIQLDAWPSLWHVITSRCVRINDDAMMQMNALFLVRQLKTSRLFHLWFGPCCVHKVALYDEDEQLSLRCAFALAVRQQFNISLCERKRDDENAYAMIRLLIVRNLHFDWRTSTSFVWIFSSDLLSA